MYKKTPVTHKRSFIFSSIFFFEDIKLSLKVLSPSSKIREQGQSRSITSHRSLQVSDEDNLEDVTVQILHGPRHGNITVDGIQTKFKVDDLEKGNVVYQHDGGDNHR